MEKLGYCCALEIPQNSNCHLEHQNLRLVLGKGSDDSIEIMIQNELPRKRMVLMKQLQHSE